LNGFIGLTPLASYYYVFLFLIVVLVFVFINCVLLKALRTPEIILLMEETSNVSDNKHVSPIAQYSASSLTTETKNELLKSLQQFMELKKPYLEPELNLQQLAEMLSVKPKALSQVINEVLQQNFFEFVNSYRIEEAKRLLTNPVDKKITILEVLYDAGFNSKSSFNTLFKKQTGLTPGEFKRKNLR
jgi:AraC-like DNA-binding protein